MKLGKSFPKYPKTYRLKQAKIKMKLNKYKPENILNSNLKSAKISDLNNLELCSLFGYSNNFFALFVFFCNTKLAHTECYSCSRILAVHFAIFFRIFWQYLSFDIIFFISN